MIDVACCVQARNFKTQITHFRVELNSLSRQLNKPNPRNPQQLLAKIEEAKTQIANYTRFLEEHQAEHVEN